ncbi:hypothetical protein LHK_00421 [Laribacter hongkongensis HLHK9]|uniref:ATP-binding protein n=1 Tax=Laribacter hongkongensis (strain HLHK9) TaxID=557598 RepID=C1DBL9_LARHH|nr:hypothetical protein [Laribacter hongkongensis]ACO73416.1 hypothetical protein LHK_00421 [Laribacter hongkongensis HLHK9]
MKKLSKKNLWYWPILSKKRGESALTEKKKKKEEKKSKDPASNKFYEIKAPRVFSLLDIKQRADVINFLKKIRQNTLKKPHKPTRIDFRQTEKMVSCGTLLFIAELDRILRATDNAVEIRCRMPKDKIVKQVLQQVGILNLLKRYPRIKNEFDASVKHWHFATGIQTDATDFDSILTEMEGKITPKLSTSIFKGVTEAMTNSCHHAYEETRNDELGRLEEKRWWMFSQEHEGKISVTFCDLGIGIPRSIPKETKESVGWRATLSSFMENFRSDQQEPALIKAAIEIGKTRTNKPNRGLGLKQIVETIDATDGGNIFIFSNYGVYGINSNKKCKAKEILIQYSDSIMGTLIQWNMPIATKVVNHGKNNCD